MDTKQQVEHPLSDLPELYRALNSRWNLVLFDMDFCLSEDNQLHYYTSKQENGCTSPFHSIPLRSVLLSTSWKHAPLSEEVVEWLMDREESDTLVRNWMANRDAPIYRRLSNTALTQIQLKLTPLLKKQSFSIGRRTVANRELTIKMLRQSFVDAFTKNTPSNRSIWKMIENDLSIIRSRKDDSLEKIAKRYKQDLKVLQSLNGNDFEPGQKIKIKYDLTSNSSEGAERRKKSAQQLFPRLTYQQQKAFIERQNSRKEYLFNYRELSHSNAENQELADQLKKFLEHPASPLTTQRKREFLEKLRSIDNILSIKEQIIQECVPSYFNLMKSMYPLLADVYEFYCALYGCERSAGLLIGSTPIDPILSDYDQKWKSLGLDALSENLKRRIDAVVDPAYLGNQD